MRVKICGLRSPEAVAAAAEGRRSLCRLRLLPEVTARGDCRRGDHGGPLRSARAGQGGAGGRPRGRAARRDHGAGPPRYASAARARSPERVTEVRKRTGLPVMKAIGVASAEDLPALDTYGSCRRPAARRRQGAEGGRAARRQRARLRLAAHRGPALAGALDARGWTDPGQRCRGGASHRRAAGGRLLGRGTRSGRQGPGENRRFRRAARG